jgi:beta-glucuronidase
VRRAAVRSSELMVRGNANHPSVFVWSLANEPAGNEDQRGQIGAGLARYIRDASRRVRRLDSTRLVAFDRQSRIGEPVTHPSYRYLDALGIHDYFGWYESLIAGLEQQRPATTSGEFGGWLDQIHAANPRLSLFVTEYGAEANRGGPPTEKGTFEFQRAWMRDHLRIYDSRSYLNGAIAWILRDFRVHPTWHGGNPRPNPPWNNKGLVDETGALKPAFVEMQRLWRRTRQLR